MKRAVLLIALLLTFIPLSASPNWKIVPDYFIILDYIPQVGEIYSFNIKSYGVPNSNMTVSLYMDLNPKRLLRIVILRMDPDGSVNKELDIDWAKVEEKDLNVYRYTLVAWLRAPAESGVYTYVARILYKKNETSPWVVYSEKVKKMKIGEGIYYKTVTNTVTSTVTTTTTNTETVTRVKTVTATVTNTVEAYGGLTTGLVSGALLGIILGFLIFSLRGRRRSEVVKELS